MVKSHINSLVPKFESEVLANIFYIVIGTKKEKGAVVYEVVSSRYERTTLSEEKLRALFDMGIISAGVKMQDGKIETALLEKTVQSKSEQSADRKTGKTAVTENETK